LFACVCVDLIIIIKHQYFLFKLGNHHK